ncbi:hypothetical protein [Brevundimonas sp. UBA7664]|uniref:hypothetical protein n=1 Tax=Brevundimonas sp. UBA7664 TaxID=1946141 RepID=UPI0025BDA9A7|nr:hypothetical protein [Brevundimonas sp. UBA7664]
MVTGRERAGVERSQREKLRRLPLLAAIVAETLPTVEEQMETNRQAKREAERSIRQRRADEWRQGRTALYRLSSNLRPLALEYWNTHRWLPGSPQHLIAMVGSIERGALTPDKMSAGIRTSLETTARLGPVAVGPAPKGWHLKSA